MTHHEILGGRVHIYRRPNSRFWQCSASLDGRQYRYSTRKDSLSQAEDVAEDWYLDLRGKRRAGTLRPIEEAERQARGKKFKEAAEQFRLEYSVITEGERSPKYVKLNDGRLDNYLIPFFGKKALSQITAGLVQEYRIHRAQNSPNGKRPSRSTIHQEIVTLRQVLKTAHRHRWLESIPDLSPPYRASAKISHRAWFSPQEYRKLYLATRKRAKEPPNPRWKKECEELHDFVLFMGNTGLRPDEAIRLEHRDVKVVKDQGSGETILEIEVRGKRGVGYCKSTTGAVTPYMRLRKRHSAQPTDKIFPGRGQRELLNRVLEEEGLKTDRDGRARTAYSLRHTYICLRLMEGADIYQIAKNCRTSVEMIEKYYAAHLKTTLDASAINVRREKIKRLTKEADE